VSRASQLLIGLGFVVLATATPLVAGADQWVPSNSYNPNAMGVNIVNSFFNTGEGTSRLIGLSGNVAYAPTSTASEPNETLCTGLTDSGACDFAANDVSLDGTILLPVCTDATQTDCVAGLSLGTDPTTMVPATFTQMTAGPTVAADPAHGLPEGSTFGLWNDSVVNAGNTTTYATYAKLQVGFNKVTNQYTLYSLLAQVIPYNTISGNYQAPSDSQVTLPGNGRLAVNNNGENSSCAWTGPSQCGRLEDFAVGTQVSMSVRLTKDIGGWFQGRMQNPSISVTSFDSTSNLITVSATSVPTPTLDVSVNAASATPAMTAFYANVSGSGVINIADDYANAFDAVNAFRGAANNTSSGVINQWSFGSYSAQGNNCLTNTSSVLGLITTNAMVFSPYAPAFTNGQLTYQVAGMHYMPDGTTPVQGTYDMVMADSVARCLYGFSSAPISGSVTVTEDSSGDQNTAVTNVSDSGGWVHLSAYGFQFSDPTISAKLTQAAPVVAAEPTKTTITCVNIKNKKLTRKVTAVKPVCPTGYRKG
jgi:hypothetical protein